MNDQPANVSTQTTNGSVDVGWKLIEVRFDGFEEGGEVLSSEFTCFGRHWCVRVYPDSFEDGMVSIGLHNLSNQSVTLQYGFSVVKNKGFQTQWNGKVSKKENEFAPGTLFGDTPALVNLHKRPLVENLVDGTLIIEVRMRQMKQTAKSTLFIPENPLTKIILNMFNNEETSDIEFEVGNYTTFHAHRFIIQECAPQLVPCDKKGDEEVTTIPITDVKPEIFQHLLYYMYGGKVSDEHMKAYAKDIIDAADKYGIINLKLDAEAYFVESTIITFVNMMDHLHFAASKNCALLQEAVLDFVVENSGEVLDKASLDDVPGSAVSDLLAATSRKIEGGKDGDDNLKTL